VYLPAPEPLSSGEDVIVSDGVTLLEADLADRGYLLSASLRAAMCALDWKGLRGVGRDLLERIDSLLGADRVVTHASRRL
jgi:hypothetical protein